VRIKYKIDSRLQRRWGKTVGRAIPNSSVFKRDLNESDVTADLVLSDRFFQTVGAVKLKVFLDITSAQTMLGMHRRLAPDERSEVYGRW